MRRSILHVVQYDYHTLVGGISKYVYELSKLQINDGNRVTIFACGEGIYKDHNLLIKRFGYKEIFRTPISISMILEFLRSKYDIVHIHANFPVVGDLIAFLAKLKNIPIVVTYHNEAFLENHSYIKRLAYKIWSSTFLKLLLYSSDAIIVTTREFASTSKILSKIDKDIFEIPCGIFIKHYERKDSNILLYVGRIKPEKGIHILLKTMARIKENNLNLRLIIVGEAKRQDEIEYKRKLDKQIKELMIEDIVNFAGIISDEELHDLYSRAIALILPSINRLEGFGIVQLEAMMHGLPIIVSDLPGVKSVAAGASILVKPLNEDELYNAIESISNNRNLWNRLSENGREKIKEYDWNVVYPKIKEVYRKVIESR